MTQSTCPLCSCTNLETLTLNLGTPVHLLKCTHCDYEWNPTVVPFRRRSSMEDKAKAKPKQQTQRPKKVQEDVKKEFTPNYLRSRIRANKKEMGK